MRAAERATQIITLTACMFVAVSAGGDAQSPLVVTPASNGAAWTTADVAKLDGDLDALLSTAPAVRGAHVGVLAVDTRTGATLYARNADDEFQPASTLKLLVGSMPRSSKVGPRLPLRTDAFIDEAMAGRRLSVVDHRLEGSLPFCAAAAIRISGRRISRRARQSSRPASGRVARVDIDDGALRRAPYPTGWTSDDIGKAMRRASPR